MKKCKSHAQKLSLGFASLYYDGHYWGTNM